MTNVIVGFVLLALVTLAVCYIVKAKKKGQACIGCPSAGSCNKNCHCGEK